MRPLRKIAVTGGIGSGKSFVCTFLQELGIPVFNCDMEAKRIIRSDAEVRKALKALVGEEVYDADGRLCKPVLAAYLCEGKHHSMRVDTIVHPKVAEAYLAWTEMQTGPVVVMECALLYESGFDRLVDEVVHVSAPEELRIERVMQRDGIGRETALRWMALQMPEEEKSARATHIIYNVSAETLPEQIREIFA